MLSWISKSIFQLLGWREEGTYPNELKKKILVVAPHTSSWDVIIGLLFKFRHRIDIAVYAKKELFTGIRGWFLTKLGFLPVDRSKSNNLVRQIIDDFNSNKIHTLGITPEGTRRKVEKFKSGFYFIAHQAQVPIVPIGLDFKNKKIIVMKTYYVTGDTEKEIPEIENMFRGIQGKVARNSFG